jgi:hypothetical protein
VRVILNWFFALWYPFDKPATCRNVNPQRRMCEQAERAQMDDVFEPGAQRARLRIRHVRGAKVIG